MVCLNMVNYITRLAFRGQSIIATVSYDGPFPFRNLVGKVICHHLFSELQCCVLDRGFGFLVR